MDWMTVIRSYQSVFGFENVKVVPFEKVRSGALNYANAILNDVLDLSVPALTQGKGAWQNESVSDKALELLVSANKILENHPNRKAVTQVIRQAVPPETDEKKRLLPDVWRQAILNAHRESNTELTELYLSKFLVEY